MRSKGDVGLGAYRMVPSAPQAPPRGWGESARVCTAPPLASMIFSFACAKNPRLRLSGDQKGKLASSVPASGWAAVESRGRTHSCGVSPATVATNASLLPSGDRAILSGSKACCSGGRMLTRNGLAGTGARNTKPMANAMAAAAVVLGQAEMVGLWGRGRGCWPRVGGVLGAQQSAGIVRMRWNAAASVTDHGQSRSSLRWVRRP